jgi:hypothetical protein
MQREDWTSARETAFQAAKLQPYDTQVLLRLSACYGQEKDYINAHQYYERALALLSVPERISYIAKLEHLRTQANDIANGVYKEDPFEKLPLEIVIRIFQLGLEDDPMLALKGSWVNQRWRNTIQHNCPELWRTWTADDQELRGKRWDGRREFWLQRAGGSFDEISLDNLTSPAIIRLPTEMRLYAPNVKRVQMKFSNMDMLDLFAGSGEYRHRHGVTPEVIMGITSLRLAIVRIRSLWGGRKYRYRPQPSQVITCGLRIDVNSLRTLELSDVGFSRLGQSVPLDVPEPDTTSYPVLTCLIAENCMFPMAYAMTGINDASGANVRYKADVLHNTLRGSPRLEHLEVMFSWMNRRAEDHVGGRHISMDHLQTAILPPPAVWSIDILAPNLKSIAFRLLKLDGSYTPGESTGMRSPLIPALEDTPVDVDTMARLESAEFVCSRADDISRLNSWISRMPNIKELMIRDIEQFPYPPPYAKAAHPANRTSNKVLQLLIDNPDWCPTLTTLCFESCFTPGHMLVEYVRKRKHSSTTAAISKLTLEGCTKLSKKAKTVLAQEVSEFEIRDEYNVTSKSGMMKKFIENNKFEAVVGVSKRLRYRHDVEIGMLIEARYPILCRLPIRLASTAS